MQRISDMNGSYVVLSGASGGFGSCMTRLLIKKYGCRVLGIGRSREAMERLSESLEGDSGSFAYRLFDVSERENWRKLASELEEREKAVDLLINNAGMLPRFELFESCGPDKLDTVMKVNFMSAVYAVSELLPLLKRSDRARLYNISSSAALCPIIGTCAYSASKGALKNYTEALHEELKGRVSVGLICPGFANTKIFRAQRNGSIEGIVSRICADPEKTARVMVRAMDKRRAFRVVGKDAVPMSLLTALAPTGSLALYTAVLKKAGLDLFADVFDHRGEES